MLHIVIHEAFFPLTAAKAITLLTLNMLKVTSSAPICMHSFNDVTQLTVLSLVQNVQKGLFGHPK